MFKYVLKILSGQNPEKVLNEMPDKDFEKIAACVSTLSESKLPRKQRRMIEKKWDTTYGKKLRKAKKI